MSSTWVWTTGAGSASATTSAPARGDALEEERRQVSARSDGGAVFVQDLEVDDRFYNYTFIGLSEDAVRELTAIFRAADWRASDINVSVTGSQAFPVGISPGQVTCQGPLNPGQGFNPGDTIYATTFTLRVRLEQNRAAIENQQEGRGVVAVRLREVVNGC